MPASLVLTTLGSLAILLLNATAPTACSTLQSPSAPSSDPATPSASPTPPPAMLGRSSSPPARVQVRAATAGADSDGSGFVIVNDEVGPVWLRRAIKLASGDDADAFSDIFVDAMAEMAPRFLQVINRDQDFLVHDMLDHAGRPRTEEAAFLGVATEPLQPQTAAQLPLRRGTGLGVTNVVEGSPAAEAGLAKHDVIAKIEDQLLVNPEQLAALIRSYEPGDTVRLTYLRGGREMTALVKLASRTQPVLAPGGRRVDLGFDLGQPGVALIREFIPADQRGNLGERLRELYRNLEIEMEGLERSGVRGEALQRMRDAMRRTRQPAERVHDSAEPSGHGSDHARGGGTQSGSSASGGRDGGSASGGSSGSGSGGRSQRSSDMQRRSDSQESSSVNEQMVWDDGETRIERTRRDGRVEFVVKNRGREVYRGGELTPADRERLDPRIREKLDEFSRVSLPPAPPAPPAPPQGAAPPRSGRWRAAPAPPPAPASSI